VQEKKEEYREIAADERTDCKGAWQPNNPFLFSSSFGIYFSFFAACAKIFQNVQRNRFK